MRNVLFFLIFNTLFFWKNNSTRVLQLPQSFFLMKALEHKTHPNKILFIYAQSFVWRYYRETIQVWLG